jgi:hypothetical protein
MESRMMQRPWIAPWRRARRSGALLRHLARVAWLAAAIAAPLCAARWVPAGPEGGTIVALAADPDHPEVIYAGGSTVFRSGDAGATWTHRGRGLPGATSLAVSSGVVYAAQDYTFGAPMVWRSADGGLSWQPTAPLPVPSWAAGVNVLVSDPRHPGRIWAAGDWSIWLTRDGGGHWVERSRGLTPQVGYRIITALALDPTDGRLWVATRSGVYTAMGDAKLWTKESEGIRGSQGQIDALAVDPAAHVVLAANLSGIYRRQGKGPWQHVLTVESVRLAVQGSHAFAVVATNLEETTGYVLHSDDHGLTWTPAQHSPDRFVLSLTASSAGGFAGTFTSDGLGGVYRTVDGGVTWHLVRSGLTNLRAPVVTTGPAGDGSLYAATGRESFLNAGLARSRDGGASWQSLTRPYEFEAVSALLVDPIDADLLYATAPSYSSVFRSEDGGATWRPTDLLPAGARVIRVDPREATALWAMGSQALYHESHGGQWQEMPTPGGPLLTLRDFTVDAHDPAVLWLAGADGTPSSARLFRSGDGGQTWTRRDSGLLGGVVTSFAFDPAAPDTLYAATDAGLFRSVDAGVSWTAVAGVPAPVSFVLATATSPTTVWAVVGSGAEVRRSRDGGVTWEWARIGLEGARVLTLAVDPLDPARVWAGTATRSVMAWSE